MNAHNLYFGAVYPSRILPAPSDFSRIVIEFGDNNLKSKATPELAQRIWSDLCNNLVTKGMIIAGAEFTQAKNLLVSINSPAAARRFMQSDIQNQLCAYLINVLEAPQNARIWVYPDQLWPRVIIHHIPLAPIFSSQQVALEAIMWELTSYNPTIQETPSYILAKSRFCEPPNMGTQNPSVSLCVPVQNVDSARRLVRNGAYIYGQRHRVSVAQAQQHGRFRGARKIKRGRS